MKINKNIKMSLASICLLANIGNMEAKPLEEAIKDVDIWGSAAFRYDSWSSAGERKSNGNSVRGTHVNRYKIAVNLSAKVNEDIKFNVRAIAGETGRSNALTMDTNDEGDKNFDVTVEHINFAYTGIQNSILTLGKQIVLTPWTNKLIPFAGSVSGTGITASTNFKNTSIFGGYYNQTNISDFKGGATGLGFSVDGVNYNLSATNKAGTGEDLVYAGAIASFGPVSAKYTIMNIDDVLVSNFFKLSGAVEVGGFEIKPYVQYSMTDLHDEFKDYNSIDKDDIDHLKLGLNVKKGIYALDYSFGKTGKNGSGIILRQSESSTFYWNVSPENAYDATYHAGNISMQVMPKLKLGLYAMAIDTKKDEEVILANKTDASDETIFYVAATYKPSKNFMIVPQIGQQKNDFYTDKSNLFRMDIVYMF